MQGLAALRMRAFTTTQGRGGNVGGRKEDSRRGEEK